MSTSMLSGKEKAAYGLGAFGKDIAYMLSSGYVLYYYQDTLHVSPIAMGIILLVARVFDAFNDPIMGVIVAKTRTKWGKFRPWLLIGTLLNAVVLYMLYTAPPALTGGGLVAYAAIVYIMWGVTYTMMDIPFWSMIPAFTKGGSEREGLTTLARSCAGVGDALITVITVMVVAMLGHNNDRVGFSRFALIISVVFAFCTLVTCLFIKEKSTADVDSPSVKQMFRALVQNDQAMTVVVSIVLINLSLYITSGLLIYFFKYDFGGENWRTSYTLFTTFGGGIQILSMMLLYPILRKFLNAMQVFFASFVMAIAGYAILFGMMFAGFLNLYVMLIPAFLVFAAFGMLTILTTVFLANTVDYGELKNHRRDDSVIFSMQTFVVKLASGLSSFLTSVCLAVFGIGKITDSGEGGTGAVQALSGVSVMGLRMFMTLIPIAGLLIAILVFKKKYILTDEKLAEIEQQVKTAG
ncbi:MAG: glycoside-pentoside-hexuronide (GPH):cation symporter [Butyrivibrio sp.]|nr:glycoside-pentoside-hexuronide (GPH):cation symporter [Butyrivibrio sp.]